MVTPARINSTFFSSPNLFSDARQFGAVVDALQLSGVRRPVGGYPESLPAKHPQQFGKQVFFLRIPVAQLINMCHQLRAVETEDAGAYLPCLLLSGSAGFFLDDTEDRLTSPQDAPVAFRVFEAHGQDAA